MVSTFKLIAISFLLVLLFANQSFAQRHGGGSRHHGNKVIVKTHKGGGHKRVVVRSKYRPAKVVVYHPVWRPAYAYHRRWVYFPRYNFYYDNWRQGYYYKNSTVWVFNTTPPPTVVNVTLENEKNYELKEDEDDVDDIYQTNDNHKTEFVAGTLKK